MAVAPQAHVTLVAMKPPLVTVWLLGGTRLRIILKGVECGIMGDSRVSYYKIPFSRLDPSAFASAFSHFIGVFAIFSKSVITITSNYNR
jgi:hypothetical protein